MLIGYACIDTDRITEYAKEHPHWTGDHWQDYFYFHQKDIPVGETDGVGDPLSDSYDMKLFLGLAAHLVSVGQKFEVYTRDNFAAVIGYNGKRFVLPAELVTVEPLTDYTDIPAERLTAIGDRTDMNDIVIGYAGWGEYAARFKDFRKILEDAAETKRGFWWY